MGSFWDESEERTCDGVTSWLNDRDLFLQKYEEYVLPFYIFADTNYMIVES